MREVVAYQHVAGVGIRRELAGRGLAACGWLACWRGTSDLKRKHPLNLRLCLHNHSLVLTSQYVLPISESYSPVTNHPLLKWMREVMILHILVNFQMTHVGIRKYEEITQRCRKFRLRTIPRQNFVPGFRIMMAVKMPASVSSS